MTFIFSFFCTWTSYICSLKKNINCHWMVRAPWNFTLHIVNVFFFFASNCMKKGFIKKYRLSPIHTIHLIMSFFFFLKKTEWISISLKGNHICVAIQCPLSSVSTKFGSNFNRKTLSPAIHNHSPEIVLVSASILLCRQIKFPSKRSSI
jgi:hypothetical protein